jgi:hypothetical protein
MSCFYLKCVCMYVDWGKRNEHVYIYRDVDARERIRFWNWTRASGKEEREREKGRLTRINDDEVNSSKMHNKICIMN